MKRIMALLLAFIVTFMAMSVTASAEENAPVFIGEHTEKGMTFRLYSDSTASVIGYNDAADSEHADYSLTPCNETGLDNGFTYYIGAGSEYEQEVTVDFIPESMGNRTNKTVAKKKYIVIHNTGNYRAGADGAAHLDYLHGGGDNTSWHYTVANDMIYQNLPDNETAKHAGDGGDGEYNTYSIGIETCVNGFPADKNYEGEHWDKYDELVEWYENEFMLRVQKLALLVAELCVRHNLNPVTDVVQHFDVTEKNCPMQMRFNLLTSDFDRENGTYYEVFFALMLRHYSALTGKPIPYTPESNVKIPNMIYASGVIYTVTAIASTSFSNKTSTLKKVTVPATVKSIENGAFDGSTLLADINVYASNANYSSNKGMLYDRASGELLCKPLANTYVEPTESAAPTETTTAPTEKIEEKKNASNKWIYGVAAAVVAVCAVTAVVLLKKPKKKSEEK